MFLFDIAPGPVPSDDSTILLVAVVAGVAGIALAAVLLFVRRLRRRA